MAKKNFKLKQVDTKGDYEIYDIVPASSFMDSATEGTGSVSQMYDGHSAEEVGDFHDVNDAEAKTIKVDGRDYEYMPYGTSDNTPRNVLDLIANNLVLSQSISFDGFTCYAQGIRIVERETGVDAQNKEIRNFCLSNSLHECFMAHAMNMTFFYFSVTEIILNRDQNKIVKVRNLDSAYCRLEKRDDTGKIKHVFYGDFGGKDAEKNIVAIDLLDIVDPLGDLLARLGKEPNDEGKREKVDKCPCKFAILSRMPMPGCRYYPLPVYFSVFRDSWYDINMKASKAVDLRISNTGAPRIHIEVHKDYWTNLVVNEGITNKEKQRQRIEEEQENLINFATGPENAGKAMISNYYTAPGGKDVEMVRFVPIGTSGDKEGGAWSEEIEVSSNAVCFGAGVNPELAGATVGRTQMNHSGSDKRELFNLKQIMKKPFHDIMSVPFHVILHFNGWDKDYTLDIPVNQLTTLDENKSHKKVSLNKKDNEES